MRSRIILVIGLALLCAPRAAHADEPEQSTGPSPLARTTPRADFLFHQPRGWINVNGGLLMPRTSGDLFSFFRDQLTIGKGDFEAREIGLEVGVAVSPRFDLVTGVEGGRTQVGSEYRDFVTAGRQSINQSTKLSRASVTFGGRYALLGHGRRLSRFAFAPRRVSPFVGAGVTVAHYHLVQAGDFVDYQDLRIFNHYYSSSGWGVGQYVQAGADIQIWRAVFLQMHGKYTWAKSPLANDFVGFDGIDLSGFRSSTGISVVF